MTKVITRYFASAAQARSVKQELRNLKGVSPRIMEIVDSPADLVDRLTSQHVAPETAEAYRARLEAGGGAVLLVRAGYKPLGVARTTRETAARMGAVDMGDVTEEVYVKDDRRPGLSVLPDHPLMLSRPRDPDTTTYYMADWPFPLIVRRARPPRRTMPGSPRFTGGLLPLISRSEPNTASIFPRHARMANWPIPLLSQRKPFTGSIFPRHARMAAFPIPLLSRRQPRNPTVIGRHTRMANWPFPLLINGQTGTNALMPGGPRMANWPISLLSKRRPFDKSIFGRHARMASFPIPLLSQRTPFTGSVIPRHARMAEAFLPLVLHRSEEASGDGGKGFSFSKVLGIPTVIRR